MTKRKKKKAPLLRRRPPATAPRKLWRFSQWDYPGKIDKQVVPLLDAMNSLPGIETESSCCGHGKRPVLIFFRVHDDPRGLFFLTRCVDRRYWKHGDKWRIRLQVGDLYKDGYRPTTYVLESCGWAWKANGKDFKGKEAYAQLKSLVENMEHHLNHEVFMNGYDLDIADFDVEEEEDE